MLLAVSTDAPPTRSEDPPPHAAPDALARWFGAARQVALLTVISRFAGLARDAICARVFGAGEIWSAFSFAFLVPNTFRRLFGEGALSAAFIPEYAQLLKSDPELARRFATATMTVLLVGLSALTIVGEIALAIALSRAAPGEGVALRLMMVMLPYMPLVCATAILAGMLQSHASFAPGAASPIILNGFTIVAASVWAWGLGASLERTAIAVSWSVTLSGVAQLAWSLWALRRHDRWSLVLAGVGVPLRRMLRRMLPVVVGLGALQINTMLDGIIASRPVLTSDPNIHIPLLGVFRYPLDEASNAALNFAQRLYQFPLGVFGVAIATVALPALVREGGDPARFNAILRRGVRSCVFIGLPASAGLIAVRHDLISVIYGGGKFTADDASRTAAVLMGYAPAVWAYVLSQTLTRSFYARGDMRTPMWIAIGFVCCNLALNFALIWPLAEAGLAWSTSICAIAQCLLLAWLVSRHPGPALFDADARRSIVRCAALTLLMGVALWVVAIALPAAPRGALDQGRSVVRLAVMLIVGAGVYLSGARLLRMEECAWLLERRMKDRVAAR